MFVHVNEKVIVESMCEGSINTEIYENDGSDIVSNLDKSLK